LWHNPLNASTPIFKAKSSAPHTELLMVAFIFDSQAIRKAVLRKIKHPVKEHKDTWLT